MNQNLKLDASSIRGKSSLLHAGRKAAMPAFMYGPEQLICTNASFFQQSHKTFKSVNVKSIMVVFIITLYGEKPRSTNNNEMLFEILFIVYEI